MMPDQITPAAPACDFECKLLDQRPSEECGCPEELWFMGRIEVTLHLEADGTGHILLDGGDWQHDWETAHTGMADLRQKAADYISKLPSE